MLFNVIPNDFDKFNNYFKKLEFYMGIHEHGYVCPYSKDILGNPKIIHILFLKELYLVECLVI